MPISKIFILLVIFIFNFVIPVNTSYATSVNDTIPNNILMYHRFDEIKYPSTNIRKEQLVSHLTYLKDQGFKFILVKDLLFQDKLQEKSVSITIDDAYLSFYEVGLPVFEKFEVPVTLFLNTENIGGQNYMSWGQLKDVLNRGVDIQNHTHSHSSLPTLSELEIANEIEKSQKLILENLGITPNLFAYPFGENSSTVQNVVSQYFDAAFGQHSGAFSINQKYFIPRFPLNENYGSIDRIKDASSVLPFNNVDIQPSNPYQIEPITRYVLDFQEDASNINCFISDFQGSFNQTTTNLSSKLLIELNRLPVKGRLRFNCTKVDNGIFWFGYQYLIN
jgi:peptidoglycan/xylan/chitin deacetylase (PgdA/CDA1 family)